VTKCADIVDQTMRHHGKQNPALFGSLSGYQWGMFENELPVGLPPRQGAVMLIDKLRLNLTVVAIPLDTTYSLWSN
jgi:hypothetical protein